MKFKVSKKWDFPKTLEELLADAKMGFFGASYDKGRPCIVLNTPIDGMDCISLSNHADGLIVSSVGKFKKKFAEEGTTHTDSEAAQTILDWLCFCDMEEFILEDDGRSSDFAGLHYKEDDFEFDDDF